jgi:mono/diheme cytochrome c family protein
MKTCKLLIITLAGLGLLAGCGESPQTENAQTTQAPPATAQAPAQAVTPREDFQIPPEGFQTDANRGQELFITHCAQCHGNDAHGTEQGPPLIHRIYEPGHHSDLAFYIAIARGTHQHHWEFGDMAPVPEVDGEDAAHIIAWIRREQRTAGIH